ncbi:hypothetical protein [Streptantibioticus silvisoli]|uniref:Uncharacterized protein n=1 Tax=Streptantibioticus silvisoli TaxID=2705255 RepID=A0ABT6W4N6_9ACTN|nr:hypothetical protein [Streptantibioticus silvisoli]MDI5965705.1 hypothetical protein [Streptantibioticus silvisoli]
MSTPDPNCIDCYGSGRRENPYYHPCDGPLCEADQPTIECECGDGGVPGEEPPLAQRPGVVL